MMLAFERELAGETHIPQDLEESMEVIPNSLCFLDQQKSWISQEDVGCFKKKLQLLECMSPTISRVSFESNSSWSIQTPATSEEDPRSDSSSVESRSSKKRSRSSIVELVMGSLASEELTREFNSPLKSHKIAATKDGDESGYGGEQFEEVIQGWMAPCQTSLLKHFSTTSEDEFQGQLEFICMEESGYGAAAQIDGEDELSKSLMQFIHGSVEAAEEISAANSSPSSSLTDFLNICPLFRESCESINMLEDSDDSPNEWSILETFELKDKDSGSQDQILNLEDAPAPLEQARTKTAAQKDENFERGMMLNAESYDQALYYHGYKSLTNESSNSHVQLQSSQSEKAGSSEPVPRGFLELQELMMSLSPQLGKALTSEADVIGIRVVHLLLAGAEAVSCMNVDLATVILARLKELASCNGSTIQRVASYFTEGLQCRVEGVKSLYKGQPTDSFHEMFAAFQALQEISPYIKFGHFTANQAILEAVGEDRKVHIIDYDIAEGVQWPSLMQALANRKSGPPHLRITVLCRPDMKRALTTVQTTGKRLAECAASFGIPFVFHQLKIDDEGEFRHSSLKILKGETLVVNCMLHLPHMPHRSPNAVLSFFRAMQRLSPTILALVEEELSCGFPSFDGHFYEAFQHYCAIFDSLEASLSSEIMTRTSVERIFLGPRIKSTLNFSNNHHNRAPPTEDLTGKRWSDLARSAGFKVAPLSTYNYCQAKLLVGLFKEGYQLKEDSNLQRLTLGWISKSLIAASVWYCTN